MPVPSWSVVKTFCREVVTGERSPRVTEPDLVMDDPDKVAAYVQASGETGAMAAAYLFQCAQICEVIRPGDTVLDLGCGPATQLAMVARLNPGTRFVGVDLSQEMLQRAKRHVQAQSLDNVDFCESDICRLSALADASVDAIMSTVALHHLPDVDALDRAFAEVARVLKPGGGLYLADFGHLKSETSITQFTHEHAAQQPELFVLDYLYSLRAAFSLEDFRRLTQERLAGRARVWSTFAVPYMVAVKSAPRREAEPELLAGLHQLRDALSPFHRTNLADLRLLFRLGGLPARLLA